MSRASLDTLLATPPERVLELTATARRRLAATPRAGELRYLLLFCDPDPHVSVALARNTALPPDLLRAVAREPDARVRAAVAGRRHVEPTILCDLARDHEPKVREAVARRRGLPWALKNQLLADPHERVRLTAAVWHPVPVAWLARYARSPLAEERQVAAIARETPDELRCALAHDPSWRVRRLLVCHDPGAQPLEILAALALAPELPGDLAIAAVLEKAIRTRLDGMSPGDVPRSFITTLMRSPCVQLRTVGRELAYSARAASGAESSATVTRIGGAVR